MYASNLISALRGGASAPPAAVPSASGITFLANPAPAASMQLTSALRTPRSQAMQSQRNFLNSPVATPGPVSAGAALNAQYGKQFEDETGSGLPDMRWYGDRYTGELGSEVGRKSLGADLRLRDDPGAGGRYYMPGDMSKPEGFTDINDPRMDAWYPNLFNQNNSMWVPTLANVNLGSPEFSQILSERPNATANVLRERARSANRALSGGYGAPVMDANQAEFEMRNYLRTMNDEVKPSYVGVVGVSPVLTALDTASGRINSEQSDAIQRLSSGADSYYRLRDIDLPRFQQELESAKLAVQNLDPNADENARTIANDRLRSAQTMVDVQAPWLQQQTESRQRQLAALNGLDFNSLSSAELIRLALRDPPP